MHFERIQQLWQKINYEQVSLNNLVIVKTNENKLQWLEI
jgi:hypothetical protein